MNLEPLRRFQVQDVDTSNFPFVRPQKEILVGQLGNTRFIVSVGVDGQVEASLSAGMRPATNAQVKAFFRKWGCEPLFEDRRSKHCRMFTVKDVRPQYNN